MMQEIIIPFYVFNYLPNTTTTATTTATV